MPEPGPEQVREFAADPGGRRRAGSPQVGHVHPTPCPFLALASGPSSFTCPALSPHLETVAWTVRQFLPAGIELGEARPARVAMTPGKEP